MATEPLPLTRAHQNEHRYEDNYFEEKWYNERVRMLPRLENEGRALDFRSQMSGLKAGNAVSLNLTPGDGTYYPLLIVPTWSSRVDIRGCTGSGQGNYLVVSYMREDMYKRSSTVIVPSWSNMNLNGLSENSWTREILDWFITGVWKYVKADI